MLNVCIHVCVQKSCTSGFCWRVNVLLCCSGVGNTTSVETEVWIGNNETITTIPCVQKKSEPANILHWQQQTCPVLNKINRAVGQKCLSYCLRISSNSIVQLNIFSIFTNCCHRFQLPTWLAYYARQLRHAWRHFVDKRALDTVALLSAETPDFFGPQYWPPNSPSPDLSMVHYAVWSILQ